uniref:RIKEN cDNA 9130008F23 gene n=1 Tax=Mus spicilegus TaxID=10103 RepID=A0A8C6H7X8_MUSSI
MNYLPSGMEPGRPQGRAECSPRREGCGPPLDSGSPNPALAEAGSAQSMASGNLRSQKGKNLDCQSWVREKVLFLLHPERWLGTQADSACAGLVDSENLSPTIGDHHDSKRKPKLSRRRIATAPGAQPEDPETTPRSLLVRVVDYQVTQEVLWTAWTKGSMTTRTEERSVTAVTFRTQRE